MRGWWVLLLACSDPHSAIDRCKSVLSSLPTGSDRFVAVPEAACADLYREPACADAWRSGEAERISAACAAAYCPHLSGVAACAHPEVATLRDLDTAILGYEGVDAATAHAIAGRTALLVRVVARRDVTPAEPVASLTLVVDETGQPMEGDHPIDPDALRQRLATLATAHGQLIIAGDRRTPHAKIVELMDVAKQAGVDRLAFTTR